MTRLQLIPPDDLRLVCRRWLDEAGYSTRGLAAAAGYTHGRLADWLAGRKDNLSYPTAWRLYEAMQRADRRALSRAISGTPSQTTPRQRTRKKSA